MKIKALAKTYAQALCDVANEKNILDKVCSEIEGLATAVDNDEQLSQFFYSPVVSLDVKREMLKTMMEKSSFDEVSKNFVYVLCDRERLVVLSEIVPVLNTVKDSIKGVLTGTVEHASDMDSSQEAEITQLIEKITSSKVDISFKKNPELVAGMIAQVGGWTIDDTISSHLNRLNDHLNRSVH
jgi:F-type H+-transporting ATPase subunit delta